MKDTRKLRSLSREGIQKNITPLDVASGTRNQKQHSTQPGSSSLSKICLLNPTQHRLSTYKETIYGARYQSKRCQATDLCDKAKYIFSEPEKQAAEAEAFTTAQLSLNDNSLRENKADQQQ